MTQETCEPEAVGLGHAIDNFLPALFHVVIGPDADSSDVLLGAHHMLQGAHELDRQLAMRHQHHSDHRFPQFAAALAALLISTREGIMIVERLVPIMRTPLSFAGFSAISPANHARCVTYPPREGHRGD